MDRLTTTFDALIEPDLAFDEDYSPFPSKIPPRRRPDYSVETLFDTLDIRGAVYEPVPANAGHKDV